MSSFKHFSVDIKLDIATPSGTLINTDSEVRVMRDLIFNFIKDEYKSRMVVGRFELLLTEITDSA